MKRSSAAANRDSMVSPRLELVPQRPEFSSLVWRKQSEQTIRCGTFALHFVERASRVVEIRIAGVDFDDIVNENHFDHMRNIDRLIGVLRENHRCECEMPAVFGGVF